MPKEIEIQANVENIENLLNFLDRNAKFESETKQVDEYYTPPNKNFLDENPVREWLRLRDDNGNFSINYKNWHYNENGVSNYCDEFQTKISDIEQAKNLLKHLNFKILTVVDKFRKTWSYQNWIISVDQVKNLGNFVEIEQISNEENPDDKSIVSEMIHFLKKIGCSQIRRNFNGYPFLLLFPDKAKYENL